jgi:hypothetical protein
VIGLVFSLLDFGLIVLGQRAATSGSCASDLWTKVPDAGSLPTGFDYSVVNPDLIGYSAILVKASDSVYVFVACGLEPTKYMAAIDRTELLMGHAKVGFKSIADGSAAYHAYGSDSYDVYWSRGGIVANIAGGSTTLALIDLETLATNLDQALAK